MSDIERALKTIDRWSRHLDKLEPETVGDAVDIDMHQDDLEHLRGVVQAARQAPASGEVERILIQALAEIENCAWGVPGYDTAEEAATWMNERATMALAEACERHNAENGPTFMGEPVLPSLQPNQKPIGYTNASQLFYLSEEEGEATIFAQKEEAGDIPVYTHPPAKVPQINWEPSEADYDHGIHTNPDAKAWSDFFMATFPNCGADPETIHGWFANAMMAVHDHIHNTRPPSAGVPKGFYCSAVICNTCGHVYMKRPTSCDCGNDQSLDDFESAAVFISADIQPPNPEVWRECLTEMVQAMHDYEMSVDEDAPYKHRVMMDRAHTLLSTPTPATTPATTPQPAQQGIVPEAVSEFVSAVRSINRSSHHHIQIPGDDEPCFWQRKEWIDWILELADQVEASLSATTPQPEGDGWVKCSDRLPTEADADFRDDVWVNDKAMSRRQYQQCLARWNTVGQITDYTHWKPTGLKRPQPPVEQGEG